MDDLEQLQLLGRGGYASVYLVRRNSSSGLYALKRIPRSKVVTEQQKLRVEAEKFILQHISSPFLCRGWGSFEATEEIALLQEYVEGRALYECVWKYKETGRFPEHVAKFFAAQLVLAVRGLHAGGFVHRDLKSGNALVGKDGFIKVIDFGLAKKVVADGGDSTQRTQSVCGTHYIMAPEVYYREPYGFSIDWWSVGVVVYEMVVGHPPWEYQCPAESTMDDYFQRIKRIASIPHQDTSQVQLSDDLHSFVSELLNVNPLERLGINGATEVMRHAWFEDIKWGLLEAKDTSVVVPYNPIADYNAARVRTPPPQNESMSSAESIDPEDNAKYFADF